MMIAKITTSKMSTTPDLFDGFHRDDNHVASKSVRSAPKINIKEFRARSSIPQHLSWAEFGRQGILAAYSARLSPYALHPAEYQLLKTHLTKTQVTIYLNIRNAILRLWHRNPLVGVTRNEAAGCARDARYFALSQVAFDWLQRNGYINFGCVDLPSTAGSIPRGKSKGSRRKQIVVIGAGVSGLGCARQLEGLVAQLGEQFTESGERPPRIIVLEGRNRIGGRVYSHPLHKQTNSLPAGLRSTAEMGAQIITGFENGNPLNAIVRGQLGLRYHTIKDNTILYDTDGKPVDLARDINIQMLWNDILGRACVYRHKWSTVSTVKGDEGLLKIGEDPRDSYNASGELIASIEDEDEPVNESNPLATNITTTEHTTTGIEKLAGRQYQTAGSTSDAAAKTAKSLGFTLQPGINEDETLDLLPVAKASEYPTLGNAMDEGIQQYHKMLGFSPQDFRLLHWHHANLEYSNASNVNDLSLSGWDQDGGNEFEGPHTKVIGGYTQVPRGLWKLPNPLDVRFNSPVKKIKYNTKPGQPAMVECTNGEIIEADRIVLTVPLGVLKQDSIIFDPPLPERKTTSIQRMGFGLLNKVILVYAEPFWESNRDGWGLLNEPENEEVDNQSSYSARRGRFYYFWNCTSTAGRPMLVAFMAGSAAHYTETVSNDQIVTEATSRLRTIFPTKDVPRPVEVIVTRWNKDPFSRGTYSYVGPKTQQEDYDIMAEPVGPIHFAGEATCGGYPATVHGAYISGLRAASEVMDELLGPVVVPTPLIERKVRIKPEPVSNINPLTGQKRKRGYVDIWEPILPPQPVQPAPSAVDGEAEAYEARIIGAILSKLGDRPLRPENAGGSNPYLLFQKYEWNNIRASLNSQRQTATGNPNARAGREEIRAAVGMAWKKADEETRRPYVQECAKAKGALADWDERVKIWDREAERVRREFVGENPPPEALRERFAVGGTAIELSANGGSRKARKL
jgi:monoamine oxidase